MGFALKICRYVLVGLLLLADLFAQERPRIGLALSGGGAKGFAHIGVLKVLEELDLPIDYIAGTSIGAVIGGLYAVGYSAAELESLVLATDWNDKFSDVINRRALTMNQKQWDGRYLLSLPLRGGKIQLPSGLIAGQKISRFLSNLTLPVHHIHDFRNLPIPFTCVATDIVTGEAVALTGGFLAEAMRASMAVPSIFTPVRFDEHLLVDGGMVRNLPAQDVVGLGAEIVIGVDVGARLRDGKRLNSLIDILNQATTFISAASTPQQRDLCDVIILPDIEGVSFSSFRQGAAIIERGEMAARSLLPQLQAIADSLRHFERVSVAGGQVISDSIYVSEMAFEGVRETSKDMIRAQLDLVLPVWLSLPELEKRVDRVYSTQLFERVNYRLEQTPGVGKLTISIVEKSEDLFRASLRYDNDVNAALLLNAVFRNVASNNALLNIDLELGEQIELDAQYFFHTGWRPGVGLSARFNYNDDFVDIFDEERREARFNFKSVFVEGLLQTVMSTKIMAAMGFRAEHIDLSPQIGGADTLSSDDQLITLMHLIQVDTQDRAYFATRGIAFTVRNEFAHRNLGSRSTFSRHYFDVRTLVPLHRRASLMAEALLAATIGNRVPGHYRFVLGGLDTPVFFPEKRFTSVSFVGLKFQELIGDHAQFYQLGLQYRLASDLYLLLRANAGNVFQAFKIDFSADRFESGVGLTLGADTRFGPMELTVMRGSRHDYLTHLSIGYKF